MNPLTRPRVKQKLRTGEMIVPGDQWSIFLYYGFAYDPEDPWNGLFRSAILISVSLSTLIFWTTTEFNTAGVQTYIYFTELRRKRAESYSLGKCTYPRHDFRLVTLNSLCMYPGEISYSFSGYRFVTPVLFI